MKKKAPLSGRIVFLSAAAGIWGAEESLLTLAKALKQNGHDVALVCLAGSLADRWRADLSAEPLIVGLRNNPDSTKFATAASVWRRYLRSAATGDAVVLFSYYLVSLAPLAQLLLIARKSTIVLDMHDNLPGRRGRLLLQFCAIFVDKIIAVSGFTARQFGPHAARVEVITRPVEQSGSATAVDVVAKSTEDKTPRIGIVGRLVQGKGHELLLEAASMMTSDFAIVVRGAGDRSPEDVEIEVTTRGKFLLGTRFEYEGAVPRERVMSGLDLLVVANDKEPLGRTVIEAQLNGVVAVVPDAGGSSELVKDGVTGSKYVAGDPRSLAEVLEALIKDADRRSAIANRARTEAVVTSSPSAYASSYVAAVLG